LPNAGSWPPCATAPSSAWAEANAAIRERLAWLNARPFKKLPGSRRSLFIELDRPALRPLPARSYEFATWRTAKVNIDYHVELERHWYSVPYQLVGQRCDVRASATTVEVFARGRQVASHLRSRKPGRHTTEPAHMPESHRRHLEWSPGRLVRWATRGGPATGALVVAILASRPHPEQGFRSCLGILRLGRRYGDERLEAAAARALAIRGHHRRGRRLLDHAQRVDLAPAAGRPAAAMSWRRPSPRSSWPRAGQAAESRSMSSRPGGQSTVRYITGGCSGCSRRSVHVGSTTVPPGRRSPRSTPRVGRRLSPICTRSRPDRV